MDDRTPNIGVYAGSFDMITLGHEEVIDEVVDLFDRLIVAVAHNPGKQYMFSVEERMTMVETIGRRYSNVKVTSIGPHRYLVDYARECGARYLVRGLRSIDDFRAEQTIREVNKDFEPEIKTIFVMPDPEVAKVSSSMVKSLIGPNGWEDRIGKYLSSSTLETVIQHVKTHKAG